jgi:integral membrane sensor domain MASE1
VTQSMQSATRAENAPGTFPSAEQMALWALAVSVAYYVGAKVGFALTLPRFAVSTLWPPNAIVLAALLATPIRTWWVILLAVLPAHLAAELGSGVPPLMVLSWFVSNCSEALIGAGCVRSWTSRSSCSTGGGRPGSGTCGARVSSPTSWRR